MIEYKYVLEDLEKELRGKGFNGDQIARIFGVDPGAISLLHKKEYQRGGGKILERLAATTIVRENYEVPKDVLERRLKPFEDVVQACKGITETGAKWKQVTGDAATAVRIPQRKIVDHINVLRASVVWGEQNQGTRYSLDEIQDSIARAEERQKYKSVQWIQDARGQWDGTLKTYFGIMSRSQQASTANLAAELPVMEAHLQDTWRNGLSGLEQQTLSDVACKKAYTDVAGRIFQRTEVAVDKVAITMVVENIVASMIDDRNLGPFVQTLLAIYQNE